MSFLDDRNLLALASYSQDALELALSVAHTQEEKALRKAEKHHRPQVTEEPGLISVKSNRLT